MNLNTSKVILKVFGIIGIVLAVFGIIGGIAGIAGGSFLGGIGAATKEFADNPEMMGNIATIGLGSLVILILAIFRLITSIFQVIASNDISKIMPAWILTLISLIIVIGQTIYSIINNGTIILNALSIIGYVVSIGIGILVFIAANNIKKTTTK